MSLNAIPGRVGTPAQLPFERRRSDSARGTPAGAVERGTFGGGSRSAGAEGRPLRSQSSASGAVPEGVDSSLWAVLDAEEIGWFANIADSGPLIYGRPNESIFMSQTALVLGGRIDVRV